MTRARFPRLLFSFSLALLSISATGASAQVIDQQQLQGTNGVMLYETYYPNRSFYPVGQSYTAGLNGTLAAISVFPGGMILNRYNPYAPGVATNDVTMAVYSGDGMSGPLLGTLKQTVSTPGPGPIYSLRFDFSSLLIGQAAGSQYTFAITGVSGDGNFLSVSTAPNSTYAGGRLHHPQYTLPQNMQDMQFRTEVFTSTVPEPSSLALLAAGLGGVLLTGWSRRRRAV